MHRILYITLFIPVGLFAQTNIQSGTEKNTSSESKTATQAQVKGAVPTETFVAGNERNVPDNHTKQAAVVTNTTGTLSNKKETGSKPE